MAKGEEYSYWDEDDACLNCGEPDYAPSKVEGLCKDCMNAASSNDLD